MLWCLPLKNHFNMSISDWRGRDPFHNYSYPPSPLPIAYAVTNLLPIPKCVTHFTKIYLHPTLS